MPDEVRLHILTTGLTSTGVTPSDEEAGATIAIGPDAHSTAALDSVHFGIGMARKGWLEPKDILNTHSADDVLPLARKTRAR